MAKYRKKPVEIEATQYFPEQPLPEGVLIDDSPAFDLNKPDKSVLWTRAYVITAHEQRVYLEPGDWIVPELNAPGRYYPIKPDVFTATYDPVK